MTEPIAGPSRKRKRPASSQPNELSIPRDPTPLWYISHLNNHIQESLANLTGTSSLQAQSTALSIYNTPAQPIHPSSSAWSAVDKSAFFASVSRHSRHRPDLISKDINKPECEVEKYLDDLSRGVEAVQRRDADQEGWRDRTHRWGKSHFWRNGQAGSARQVSDDWITKEEDLALRIVEVEPGVHKENFRKRVRKIAIRDHLASLGLRSDRAGDQKELVDVELKKRWDLEDYGEDLDAAKLGAIDSVMKPHWQEWYASRLNGYKTTMPVEPEQMESVNHLASMDKFDKIAVDNQRLKAFEAIGHEDMTKEQRVEYRLIVNRKRMRERYRLKKLAEMDMSKEEVEEQGGVDVVYSKKLGKASQMEVDLAEGLEVGGGESISLGSSTSRHMQRGEESRLIRQLEGIPRKDRTQGQQTELSALLIRQKARTKYRRKKLQEAGIGNDEIEICGGVDAVYTRRVGRYDEDDGAGPSQSPVKKNEIDTGEVVIRQLGVDKYLLDKGWDVFNYAQLAQLQCNPSQPHISFSMLSELHAELKEYLTSLLYHLIILVETQQEQYPSNNHGWICGMDVYQTASFRGETPPTRVLEEYNEQEVIGSYMQRKYKIHVDPPEGLGWGQMEMIDPDLGDTTVESEDEDLAWDSDKETTLTDDEDVVLDDLLEELDEAYDELQEEGLWEVAEARVGSIEDWTIELFSREVGDEQKRIICARAAYVKTSRDIGKARRQRHALRQRKVGFRGALKKAKWGGGKSVAIIISESEEEVDGDVASSGSSSDVRDLESEEGDDEGEGQETWIEATRAVERGGSEPRREEAGRR